MRLLTRGLTAAALALAIRVLSFDPGLAIAVESDRAARVGAGNACASVFGPSNRAPGSRKELAGQLRRSLGSETPKQMLSHLKIASFNLENFRAGEWTHRKDRRALAILREAPHVLVVQEIESLKALQELAAHLGQAYVPLMVEGNKPGQHIAFLVRTDLRFEHSLETYRNEKFRIGRSEPRPVFNRDFPVLRLLDPGTGAIVLEIGGVHLKSLITRPNQPDSALLRAVQSERTVEILNHHRGNHSQLAVGDFQGRTTLRREYAAFGASGFQDLFDTAGLTAGERITHVYFPENQPIVRAQLDAVLGRDLPPNALVSAYVHPHSNEKGELLAPPQSFEELRERGSDHSLIIVVLDLSSFAPAK
jgi:hypothetical protein